MCAVNVNAEWMAKCLTKQILNSFFHSFLWFYFRRFLFGSFSSCSDSASLKHRAYTEYRAVLHLFIYYWKQNNNPFSAFPFRCTSYVGLWWNTLLPFSDYEFMLHSGDTVRRSPFWEMNYALISRNEKESILGQNMMSGQLGMRFGCAQSQSQHDLNRYFSHHDLASNKRHSSKLNNVCDGIFHFSITIFAAKRCPTGRMERNGKK